MTEVMSKKYELNSIEQYLQVLYFDDDVKEL